MYALCVSVAVNTQGFCVEVFYALYINFHSFKNQSCIKVLNFLERLDDRIRCTYMETSCSSQVMRGYRK